MADENTYKNSSKNSKPSKNISEKQDHEIPLYPSWCLIALLGCIKYTEVCVDSRDYINGFDKPPLVRTLIVNRDYFLPPEAKTKSEDVQRQMIQEIINKQMWYYEQDKVSLWEDFKSFEKSMECTINYLIKMENEKGRRFMIRYRKGEYYPPKDVRLFTDLVYLQQKGFIELPSLLNITSINQEVDQLEVKLLIPAKDIANLLLPEEAEAEYRGLKFFTYKKRLIYGTKSIDFKTATTKSMRLLTHMMQQQKPWPLKDAVRILGVKTNIKDKTGRNAVDNILNTARKYLNKLDFPWTLSLTAGAIVWQNK